MNFHASRKGPSFLLVAFAAFLACSPLAAQEKAKPKSAVAKTTKCPTDDTGLTLPPGFCATIFADNLGHARHMAVGANGVLYVNTWSSRYFPPETQPAGGFLVALQDKTGTGKATDTQRFGETAQTGAAGGTGIGLYRGWLYAEVNDRIVRYSLPAGAVVPSGSPETIVAGMPMGADHPMHPFFINPRGSLLVDIASATNSCQEKNRTLKSPGISPCVELETRGGIWRYDANKTGQHFSPAERYATGIRNGEGFAMDAAGNLFVSQHGRDQLHMNWPDLYKPDEEATLPAEEVMLLNEGGDYGWPFCYYDNFQKKLVLAPEYGGDGGKKVGDCANKLAPVAAYPAHWAPNALLRYDQKQFPARYRRGIFIAFHGSWDRAPYQQQGYNVVFQPLDGARASAQCEIFADGFAGSVKSPDKAEHRPSGLAVGTDGALYVSDDVHGRIYRIVYVGGVSGTPKYTSCPSLSAPAGATAASAANPPEGTDPNAGAAAANPPEGATVEMVALGSRIYRGQVGGAACTGCHGDSGQGSPLGPDLTGKKWLWSDGSFAGIAKTITEGVSQPKQYRSPMPAMGGSQLTADQVKALAAYVWSISHRPRTDSSPKIPTVAEISVHGENLFTESITSTSDGQVFIGSIGARTIFVADPGSSLTDPFVPPDADTSLGVYGVFADESSNTLWACFSSPKGEEDTTSSPSTLKAFDLQTAVPKGRYPLPTKGAFCNDIAVGADGTAYVSDTANMEVVRLPKGAKQLEVWAGNGAFGPKGGILDGISVLGNRLFVNTLETNKLFVVPIGTEGKAGTVAEVKLDRPVNNPDGMRSYGTDKLLIVEGGGHGRASIIKIAGDSGQVTTLKEGYPDGVVAITAVGKTAYVLEGQLDLLFGPKKPDAKTKPFHASAVDIGQP